MKTKVKFYLIFLAFFIAAVSFIGISFAFIDFDSANNQQIIPITGSIKNFNNAVLMRYEGNTDLNLQISLDDLSSGASSNNYLAYSFDEQDLDIIFSSNPELFPLGVKCDYNIFYIPDSENVYNASPDALSNNLVELALEGTNGNETDKFEMFNLAGLTAKTLIKKVSISTFEQEEEVIHKWNFKMKFYNLNVDQSSIIGQNPHGTIAFETDYCEVNK